MKVLLGNGKMKLARDPKVGNTIVPIQTNIILAKSNQDNSDDIMCIMIG